MAAVVCRELDPFRFIGAVAVAREPEFRRISAHHIDDASEALEIRFPAFGQMIVKKHENVALQFAQIR